MLSSSSMIPVTTIPIIAFKVSSSHPTKCSAGLWDPTSLQGPIDHWVKISKQVVNIGLVSLAPWQWPKFSCGAAKYQLEKQHQTSGRAVSVSCSILPFNTINTSVNSLVSSYVVRSEPLSFKTTKSLVPKSMHLLKLQPPLNILLVEQFLMKQFLIQ